MLLGVALVPAPRARSAGALGAIAAGLALVALRAAAPAPVRLDGASLSGLPGGFVSVDAALVILAVVLAALALVEVLRRDRTAEALAGAGALAAGALAIAWGGRALPPAAPPGSLAAAMVVIAGVGTLLVLTGRRVRLPRARDTVTARPRSAVAGLLLGALGVAAGPHLAIVFLGVIAAGWSGWLLQRARGGSKVPVAPVLTLLLLPAYWLMAAIAGPEGLWIGGLGELPLSPAAELLLAPALLLAAWSLAGLWPLQRQQPGPLTAVVGVLLLIRVTLPTMPEGMEHWRALVMPILVIGLWHAALGGRWSLLAVAMAWMGAIAPGRTGPAGAGLLLVGALLLEPALGLGAAHPRGTMVVRVVAGLAAGWGALLAMESSLRGEVVYSVLAVGGLVAAVGGWAAAQAMTAREPSTTAPSA